MTKASTLKEAIKENNYNVPCGHPLWTTAEQVAYPSRRRGCEHITEYYHKQSCLRCAFIRTVGIPPIVELVEEIDDDSME